jgi:hypothetical protein
MDPTAAPRAEPHDSPALTAGTTPYRLPLGVAAAVIALISGGLWIGLIRLLRALL